MYVYIVNKVIMKAWVTWHATNCTQYQDYLILTKTNYFLYDQKGLWSMIRLTVVD